MKNCIVYFLILIFLNLTYGCSTYKVVTKDSLTDTALSNETNKGKYFIIHQPGEVWHLANAHVADNYLLGDKEILDTWHQRYELPQKKSGNVYNRKDSLDRQVVNEIHIYTDQVAFIGANRAMIPINSITSYEFYMGQNKAVLPVIIGALSIILIIITVGGVKSSISNSSMSWHI